MVRDPLIVDQDDYVILDGMHRFSSLKSLECRFVPCCLVDYQSPKIKVGAWFRLFAVSEPESLARELLAENNLNHSERKIELHDTKYDTHCVILTARGMEFYLNRDLAPLEQARIAVLLEKAMAEKGFGVEYLSEIAAVQRLISGKVNFVISLPIFTKEQIRDFGLRGLLLPHKVTRHVIPSRPLRIDVPLQMLRDPSISQSDADRKLGELLAHRHVEKKPPGSSVDGRRYEEELLVFSA
jgi:hypothetical protein